MNTVWRLVRTFWPKKKCNHIRTFSIVLELNALLIISGGILANIGAGLVFALRALNSKPARVLRNYE